MIICLGTTPAVQRVMIFNRLTIDAVNRAVEVAEGAAGKSVNVARVLRQLGRDAVATGFLGGDRGETVRGVLDREGVRHDFVTVRTRTRMCVTLVDRGAESHTELVEESRAVESEVWGALRAKLTGMLPRAEMLVLSGTLVPGASADFYYECTRLAADAQVPVIVDATGEALKRALSGRPRLVKPNRAELAGTTGMAVDTPEGVRAAMQKVLEMGAQSIVVTMGGEGTMAGDGQGWWHVRVPKVKAVNSIGSGDSFAAGLAAGLVEGKDFAEAVRFGAACGTANALTLMAADVRPADVKRLLPQVVVEKLG